jgi:hypothetical protein
VVPERYVRSRSEGDGRPSCLKRTIPRTGTACSERCHRQTRIDFFSNLHPVALALKEVVYEVGAPLDHVYFIEDGVASILTRMANGE